MPPDNTNTRAADRFIDGVYNHCDRWCERCPLTDRCQLHAMEPPSFATPESRDPRHPAFWNALSLCFAQANRRLRRQAADEGDEPDRVIREVHAGAGPEAHDGLDEAVRSHPLVVAAGAYGRQVDRWLDDHGHLLAERERTLADAASLALPEADPDAESRRLQDALETVLWYQHLVEIKLALSIATRLDLERHGGPDEEPYVIEMMLGSAKVALLGLDRSLAAWRVLRGGLDDPRDPVLPMLARLDRLRRDAEAAFPEARAFRRPGFDRSAEPGPALAAPNP
jgi:hypothetical protein